MKACKDCQSFSSASVEGKGVCHDARSKKYRAGLVDEDYSCKFVAPDDMTSKYQKPQDGKEQD